MQLSHKGIHFLTAHLNGRSIHERWNSSSSSTYLPIFPFLILNRKNFRIFSQNEVIKKNFIAKNARNAWRQENRLKRSKSTEDLRKAIDAKNKQQTMYDLEIRGTVPD